MRALGLEADSLVRAGLAHYRSRPASAVPARLPTWPGQGGDSNPFEKTLLVEDSWLKNQLTSVLHADLAE
jgi:hypothetical protein